MTRVLLTGGSGFVAIHVLQTLLESGYSVVTTVRSTEKIDKIRAKLGGYGKDKLEFAIVEDIAVEGAFDEAVKANPPFDAVLHTASPFHLNATDIQKEMLDPAVVGTVGVLRSIKKFAPAVKTVVITSSFAAIVDPSKGNWPDHTYSEADWNPTTHEEAIQNGRNGYRASKTFAERAAWDFLEKEKPNFTIATVCPPLIFGPVAQQLNTLESVNTSNQMVRDLLAGKHKDALPPTPGVFWVDVRDVALAHVRAIEKPDAANKRFFVTAGYFSAREIAEIIRKEFPAYDSHLPDASIQAAAGPDGGWYKYNTGRAREILGIKFKPLKESITDTVKSLQALGA